MAEKQIQPDQVQPSPDFDEYAIAAGDFDLASIGGYPARLIEVVGGSGTLKVRTTNSVARDGTAWRTASGLVVGSKVGPCEVALIAGTTNGSSAGLTIRVYK